MMKKGFTLVELLAVIVILTVILVIAIPSVSSIVESARLSSYQGNVKLLEKAARNYLAFDETKLPINVGDISVITLTELQSGNYISTIKDLKDSNIVCEGYVVLKKASSSIIEYAPSLKCGSNYQTEGYMGQSLTSVEVLVVAGGGAGGTNNTAGTSTGAGGGGAGGLIFNANYVVISGQAINVTVGAGGISPTDIGAGGNGNSSSFGTISTVGGGGGGYRNGPANAGGSGGGVGYITTTGGAGTSGQGNTGGSSDAAVYGGAGGGGAGAVGQYCTGNAGTNGGAGLYYGNLFDNSIGNNGWFAGGGGGGSGTGAVTSGIGGNGGGGNGGLASNGTNGLSNTGGGGGGSSNSGYIGGTGGSGIVIVRYSGAQRANGGNITYTNGYTIHTFTSGTSNFTALSF